MRRRRARAADGIVVLTGGEHRLSEAARLLAEGRGKRLLISGANRMATREDLHRKSGLAPALFDCCVDIGYDALTTSGNAQETKAWASGQAVHPADHRDLELPHAAQPHRARARDA